MPPRENPSNNDPIRDRTTATSQKRSTRPNCTLAGTPKMSMMAKPSKAEIIKNSQSNIKSVYTARKWLHKHEYIVPGENLSASVLTMALLYLANGCINTTSQLINGIRAVAICLDDITTEQAYPDTVKDAIEVTVTELAMESVTIISNLAENAIKSISEVEVRCKELIRKAQEHSIHKENGDNAQYNSSQNTHWSYADALKRPHPPTRVYEREHSVILAKESMLRKQILIDGIEGTQNSNTELTLKLLMAKANLAINLTENSNPDAVTNKPSEAKIVSAKMLDNKGVVYEATSKEAAASLKRRARDFTAGIGSQAMLKSRNFHLVIEFISTSLDDRLPNIL